MTDRNSENTPSPGPRRSGADEQSETTAARAASGVTRFNALSERLKQVRLHIRKTQSGMDALLGLGKGSWQRYESGGQIPGSQVVARVTTLGYSANWLLTGTGPMLLAPPFSGKVTESSTGYGPGAIEPDVLREVLEVVEPRLAGLEPAARADLIVDLARWAQAQRDRERSEIPEEPGKDTRPGQRDQTR